MRSTILTGWLVAACIFGAACATTHPVHYYTLGEAPAPFHAENPDGPTILVGAIATPAPLQDDRIRYRIGANEVGAYEFHRWMEQPGEMVRETLVRALRSSGGYRRVMESSSSMIGDYLVRGKLYEFGETDTPAIETRVSLQLELVDRKTNRSVWDHLFERQEPAAGKTIEDVVESMDRNLEKTVGEAAAEIGKFFQAAAPPRQ